MTKAGRPAPGAIQIIPKPPFVRLPDPARLFADRAARFRRLAEGHALASYLRFLAGMAEAQSEVAGGLPYPEPRFGPARERADGQALPPLDRAATGRGDEATMLLDRFVVAAAQVEMPPAAAEALRRVAEADAARRDAMVAGVLADAAPIEAMAEHAMVAAALQVGFARRAGVLDPEALRLVGDGVCPVCGGPPVASLDVGWRNAEGTRFCACSLCGTLWNYVRAKCALCASTRSITLRELGGGNGTIKAEACGDCRGYVKVLYQQKDPDLDPVADDVASLGLDLLMREAGFRRGAVNPFLVGY